MTANDVKQRKYDLVLVGATGFTGNLAAQYLAKQYGREIRWAIAGRRKDALVELQKKLTSLASQSSKGKDEEEPVCDVVIVDTLNEESLKSIVPVTRVIISTVGPFINYGSVLVKVCAEYGTHYADITGESDWVRTMIDHHHRTALASGARIVHMCGHDCIPWDLTTNALAEYMKQHDDQLREVRMYDEIVSSPSGGTLETMFEIVGNPRKFESSCGFDPLLLANSKPNSSDPPVKGESVTVTRNRTFLGYVDEIKSWTGPFLMAMVNVNCVKRSNALLNYGPRVAYNEQMVYPNIFAGVINFLTLTIFGISFFCPPFKYFLRTFVLPAPGEGPSTKSMDRGFLNVTAIGEGLKGTKAKAVLYFPTDPGYRDTARMLVESGVCLALDAASLKSGGGVLTPAACFGNVLLDRLQRTGCTFIPPQPF